MAASDKAQASRIDALVRRVEQLEDRLDEKDERIDELEETVYELQRESNDNSSRLDAISKKADANTERVSEIQSRELEKGAHLDWENVSGNKDMLSVDGNSVERFEGDNGDIFARLPGSADPLERSGTSKMAQGDLLPIQQLARLDDDMLRSTANALPSQLAAKVWSERQEGSIDPWSKGSSSVRQYLDSSDLRHWIRREQDGVSETYAKKLAQRTMDAIEDLAKGRLYSQRKSRRKDGLQYKERRLILPADSEIPGEREE